MKPYSVIPAKAGTPYLWPGLASYQEQDRHLFYGRQGEIFDLTRKIISSRLTILFGPSGAGKTSLLQAGVFPKLREQNFLPVLIRLDFPLPGEPITPVVMQFEGALSRECKNQGIETDYSGDQWFAARKDQLSLWEWLRSFVLRDSAGGIICPVFVFDQFEEIFTLGKNARGLESFIRQIGDAAENFMPVEISDLINVENAELPFDPTGQPYKMIIALRDDYLAQLQGLRQVLPGVTVRQNHFSLVRLTGSQALEAITGPAPAGMISERVANEIIHFVANASDSNDEDLISTDVSLDHLEVEPAILSLVCQQLDLKRQVQGEQSITVDFVKQSKGQILEEFYESAMQPVHAETRSFIEDHLLDAEGFRTSEPESNLLQHQVPGEDIRHLIDLRLLHRVEFYHRSHLELSHDVLAPVVKSSRDSRTLREEAIRRDTEIRLLKKQRRRSAVLTGIFAGITLCALIAGYFSIRNQKAATAEKRKAVSLYLVSNSQIMTRKNTDQAICLARLACQIDSSSISAGNIQNIVYDNGSPLSSAILKGHRDMVYSAVFSPDGSRILTASRDSTAKVWDTDGNLITDLKGHRGEIFTAVFSGNGERILTTSADSTARLWDKAGNLVAELKGHQGVVFIGVFSPDGKYMLTGGTDLSAKLWDHSGNLVTNFSEFNSADFSIIEGVFQHSLAFSPDGRMLATTALNGRANVWDLKGNLLVRLTGHKGSVTFVAFSPDGNRILTTGTDSIVKIWDLKGKLIADLTGFEIGAMAYMGAFSPDGKLVAIASTDKKARLWDCNGNHILDFKGHKNCVYSVCFSPDGQQVLTCGDDNTAKLWDLKGNLVADLKGHQRDVITACFSPDGKKIVAASYDHTVKIWNLEGGLVTDLKGHRGPVWGGYISRDGNRIFTVSSDSTLKVWNLKGNLLGDWKRPDLKNFSAIISPGWKQLIAILEPKVVELWDSGGILLDSLKHLKDHNFSASISDQLDRILTCSDDGTATNWDLIGNRAVDLKGHQGTVVFAVFTRDGSRLLTVYPDYTCKLWDSEGNLKAELKGHTARIRSAVFSPDGTMILTASDDYTAKLWDLKGQLVANLIGHVHSVTTAVFSPDGKLILTGSSENTARLWDLKGNTIAEYIGHQGALLSAIFSPDGNLIATGAIDNTAKIWDLKGNMLADLRGHRGWVYSVIFSPDGKRVVTFSYDGTAKIWPGLNEMMSFLSKNSHREKLSIKALVEIPLKLSKEEFEKAVRGNIVDGNYQEYRQLIRQNKDK